MATGYRVDARPPEYSRYIRFGQKTGFTLVNKNLDGTANNEVLTNVVIKIYTQSKALIETALYTFNYASGISQVGNLIICDLNVTAVPIGKYDWTIDYVRGSVSTCVYQGFLDVSNQVRPNCDIVDTYSEILTINSIYQLAEELALRPKYHSQFLNLNNPASQPVTFTITADFGVKRPIIQLYDQDEIIINTASVAITGGSVVEVTYSGIISFAIVIYSI